MKDLIRRTAAALALDVPKEDIHRMLVTDEGMTEYEAFLTYQAAKILAAPLDNLADRSQS